MPTFAELNRLLRSLLSLPALVKRAGIAPSTWRTYAVRGVELSPDQIARLRESLEATAKELQALAKSLK